jgi:hypothetical protein
VIYNPRTSKMSRSAIMKRNWEIRKRVEKDRDIEDSDKDQVEKSDD